MDAQVADGMLGSLVDGRYRIRGRVSRGGMATVYTAVDERLDRTVALKIIHSPPAGDARGRSGGFFDRFTDEAKTIARLTHPNVVAVYDQGTHAGSPYLVMEYVRGRTLRDVLAERHRLNPAEAVAIMEQVLAALAAAHRAGVVHRDVKPENILVAEAPSGGAGNLVDSVVKVADFGLARAIEASAKDDGGQLMATVAYVAPELVTDGRADPRTDVYSAGIVLFEMLTGRVPYDGDRPVDVAWQHVDREVPAPSTLVAGLYPVLDDLVTRATRRDLAARPSDAGALLADVQAVREALGNANANTALLRQLSPPTMVVSSVPAGPRPSWARLPASRDRPGARGRRAAAASPGLDRRLQAVGRQLMRDRSGRLAVVAAALVLVLLAVGGGWWYGVGRYAPAPQLTSLAKAEAETRAARSGFAVRYGQPRYDEQVANGVVLTQQPAPSSRVVKGGVITLVLSLGPERYRVPDAEGKAFDVAKVELERAKLVVTRGADRYDDNLPAGVVLEIRPPAGTQTRPGDSVTVTVSKGRAPLSVPNLVGKNINDARAELQQMGLVPVETYKDSDKPKDEVIGQSPADGAGVEPGAEVRLEVSKGPPAVPVPPVVGMPCPQAQQLLQSQQFTVRVDFNPNGTVSYQNPPPNSPVPPGSEVVIACF